MKPLIAVLITCYNRKEKTLICLQSLFKQTGLGDRFIIEVFLVDDGCTDGTAEFINFHFPNINIIKGNGNLYWNRGMHLAWDNAVKINDFDFYLWLNDDTYLFNNSLNNLIKDFKTNSIIVGSTKSLINYNITYGGFKNNTLLIPNGNIQVVDYFNGNCVLIPNTVFKSIGNLDPTFHHALGDFDYGLRAKKNGFKIYISSFFVATCESHIDIPNWRNTKFKLNKRLIYLYKPNSGCNPFEYFHFDCKHYNIFIAIFHFFSIHFRCTFPILYKNLK